KLWHGRGRRPFTHCAIKGYGFWRTNCMFSPLTRGRWGATMHIIRKAAIATGLLLGFTGLAHASYITTFSSGTTTSVAGATVVTSYAGLPASYAGDGSVVSGSLSGYYAAPAGDSTPYLSVAWPKSNGSETYTADLGQSFDYFGLYWGSMDDYNTLKF